MVAGLEADTLRKVDINRAGLEELESLPGIGPVLARRILEFRETNGPFRRSRDLLLVRGIGEKRMARLEPYITLTP
ncbi:MAG TPA: helix-hairpin-helix domain-containing protein [Bacteroidetes bacterium]|nr:helix-hairpin-helix domain-containing protein [Bacteroidota bacterium]